MHILYAIVCLGAAGAVLLVVSTLNTAIYLSSYIHGSSFVETAVAWQRREGGFVHVPVELEMPFKMRRFQDKAATLETAVFGSSRVAGFSGLSYNFSTSSNLTATALGQARYVLDRAPKLRTIYMSIEWAVRESFIHVSIPSYVGSEPPPPLDLDVFRAAVQDSLNLPRVRNLATAVYDDLRGTNSSSTLLQLLAYGSAVVVTNCPDGTVGARFGLVPTIICGGYRDDGSGAFFSRTVARQELPALIARGTGSESSFVRSLALTGGKVIDDYLDATAILGETMRKRGGEIVVLVPPMAPGMERALEKRPGSADSLRTFKAQLQGWSQATGIRVVDGGPSEDFGCAAEEFYDGHHAKPACFARIMEKQ